MTELLTVDEVAGILRVSKWRVYQLANEHRLRGAKAGSVWRFRREWVDEYIDSCTV